MSNRKEIIRNLFSFSMIEMLSLLIPIITMPILTRSLGAEVYGEYLLFLTIMLFGQTIIDYGVQYTGVRDAAKSKDQPSRLKNIFERYQGIRVFFCLVYILCALLYSYLFLTKEQTLYIINYGVPYLLGYTLSCYWFYQAIAETQKIILAIIIPRFFNMIMIVFFVRNESDVFILYSSFSYSVLISGIYLTLLVSIGRGYKIFIFDKLKEDIRNGINTFIGILSPNLYNTLPAIIMGSIYSSSSFALFVIATRLCSVIVMLQGILSKSIYPFLSRAKESYLKKVLFANLIITIPIVVIIFFWGGGILTYFLGSNFSPNIYLDIISVGTIFLAISNAISVGFFLPNGYDIVYRNVALIVSLIASVVGVIVIYNFGLVGGAITLTFARFLYFVLYTHYYIKFRKHIHLQKDFKS